MKANEDVFKTLLKQQPFYETTDSVTQLLNYSVIHFGNPDAQLKITILTNPFCNPCAKMHKRVEKLLK
jgi:protein-disulfide isomerase